MGSGSRMQRAASWHGYRLMYTYILGEGQRQVRRLCCVTWRI